MKINIYKVWNLSCRGDKIVFFHLFRYDFGTRLFLSGFHDSSVDFVSAYWLGVIPTFDLNTLAKYFGSVNPTLYAISLMRKECVAMSCIARLRRISRIRDAGVRWSADRHYKYNCERDIPTSLARCSTSYSLSSI